MHAAVLVVMPPLVRERELPAARTLEATVLRPEQLPAVFPGAALQPALTRAVEAERMPARVLPEPKTALPSPVLASPEPRHSEGASLMAEPDGVSEGAVAVPERRSLVAIMPVTPPGSNVAYLRNPAPRYPLAARRAGEQGTVTLRVLVTRDGLAARVKVEKSSGSPDLDAAALEAVKAWRFTPARQGADAVESWMLVPIVFRLEGTS